jgi:parallel beta-helix repeat protein
MKKTLYPLLCLCLSLSLASADYLDPQGPPGSIITKMPTLIQIEPRQAIESLPFVITNSGPYVLTRNLTASSLVDGVSIQTNSVSINLNGFTLKGIPGSGNGITVSGSQTFIVIRNGVISGWGQGGVSAASANNSKTEDLLVSGNGANGIALGTNCAIARCTAANNTQNGFTIGSDCIIMDSTAKANGGMGFSCSSGCVIQKCVADQNTSYGFKVNSLGQIVSCTASGNGGDGFNLQHSCSVLDSCANLNWQGFCGFDGIVFSRSVAYSNQYGFYAAKNCSFSACSAYANTWQGIYGDNGCSFENCSSYGNFDGIGARGGGKITGCSVSMNTGEGYWLGQATYLEKSSAYGNSTGVAAQAGCYISGNEISLSSGPGILATNQCRIENNHIVYCGTGIKLTGSECILSGNTLLNNTKNYDLTDSNQLDLIVTEVPTTISWPAKARLAGTITMSGSQNGITISADGVCLDLDGHSLVGAAGARDGIIVSQGCENVEIRNGVISDWGYYAIDASAASSMKVTGIRASTNGYGGGIYGGMTLGSNSVVKECQVVGNKGKGLYVNDGSVVADSVFSGNTGDGAYLMAGCTIANSTACKNGNDGIYADTGTTINHCASTLNTLNGIETRNGCTIESCVCSRNSYDGIRVSQNNQVLNNTCDYNSGNNTWGIELDSSHNTVDGNSLTRNDLGIGDTGGGNLIIRNRMSGNTNNYNIGTGSTYGPIVTNTGAISTTSPWANFVF